MSKLQGPVLLDGLGKLISLRFELETFRLVTYYPNHLSLYLAFTGSISNLPSW
jgi:hypothetical protein